MTRASKLKLVEGGVYRNGTGGELHAIQRMRHLTHGQLLSTLSALVIGEVWLMESRGGESAPIPYLVTPDALAVYGYARVGEVPT